MERRDTEVSGRLETRVPWLVIGLGNFGSEYENTYHNVGFRVVNVLARRFGVSVCRQTGSALLERVSFEDMDFVLVLPQTYMNRSGEVLPILFDEFGEKARIVVVSDDLALPLGKIRIREKGSAGGHNGLKSMDCALGSGDYLRVRVGIEPDRAIGEMREFVLSEVFLNDIPLLEQAQNVAADAIEYLLREGPASAMGKYNGMDLRSSGDSCYDSEP